MNQLCLLQMGIPAPKGGSEPETAGVVANLAVEEFEANDGAASEQVALQQAAAAAARHSGAEGGGIDEEWQDGVNIGFDSEPDAAYEEVGPDEGDVEESEEGALSEPSEEELADMAAMQAEEDRAYEAVAARDNAEAGFDAALHDEL